MAREFIPDAVEGSAPSLEIKRHIGRVAPSEGGESAHSVALTNLSNMRLDGVPIAQKIAEKKFNYLDVSGNLIAKDDAMKVAGGVVYYQDSADPSKGRLRHRGTFVSTDDARTIVSGSRASNTSDIANLQDVEDCDVLPSVMEDDEETGYLEKKGISGLSICLWLIVFGLLVFTATTASIHFRLDLNQGAGDVKLLGPELSQLLEKQASQDNGSTIHLLQGPLQSADESLSLATRKALAAAEIDRILACRKVGEILGDGGRIEHREAFNRIARLLHPDKGLVSENDPRAALALRLTLAARRASLD